MKHGQLRDERKGTMSFVATQVNLVDSMSSEINHDQRENQRHNLTSLGNQNKLDLKEVESSW